MYIITQKSGLVHFLKGVTKHPTRPFSEIFLTSLKKESPNWICFKNSGKMDYNLYKIIQNETGWVQYIDSFLTIGKYLLPAVSLPHIESLKDQLKILEIPKLNSTSKIFKENLEDFILLANQVEIRMNEQLKKLTCLECERLGEAITCNLEGCYTAGTVMAASAIEARLHYLIHKKNKKLYKKSFKDKTLGTIIKLFDKNEYKDKKYIGLKKIVPDKHKSLLDIVNTYRIFSAHPILSEIDPKVADSVLNLSFLFLLDPELKISSPKLLSHN